MSRSAFCLGIDVNDLTRPILTKEQIEWERNTHHMKDKTKFDWSMYDQTGLKNCQNAMRYSKNTLKPMKKTGQDGLLGLMIN